GPNVFASTTSTWFEDLSYENLFTYNGTETSAASFPWLATGYSVNSNAQVWNITLRQGVKYTDGTSFNATGVKAGVEDVILSDFTGSGQIPTIIRGASAYFASNHNAANQTKFLQNDGITVLSTYVIEFNLSQSESDFLTYLTSPLYNYYSVSPSAIVANGGVVFGVGSTWMKTHTAGTGPYMLQSYDPATGTLVYLANPNWWGISVLGLKQPFEKITMNVVANLATQELDVRTGGANMIPLPTSNIFDFANRTLWTAQSKLASVVPGVSLYGPYAASGFAEFILNSQIHVSGGGLATVQPFQNAKIVAGINEAWNESAFIQQDLNGIGIANPSILVQGQLGYTNFAHVFQYNLTKAKADLNAGCQALGFSTSNPLIISMYATNDQTGELSGSLMASNVDSLQTCVTLNLIPEASSAKITVFLAASFGIFVYEQPTLTGDPLSQPLAQMAAGVALHSGFSNSQVTALLNQAYTTTNITQRSSLYSQIDQGVAQTGQYIKIAQIENVYATNGVAILPENPWLINTLPWIFAMQPS
ncbi:MAG: hypothetical protein JRN67_01480, partial [Nitrososphaerota archaeon]|nr:hypothetical protein [Nitrososphaerota archaeon]